MEGVNTNVGQGVGSYGVKRMMRQMARLGNQAYGRSRMKTRQKRVEWLKKPCMSESNFYFLRLTYPSRSSSQA
ncbi:MAG TPA: hypothetical protein DIV79_12480 [Opitutae bacterium]|nr:hypothetical protein [Opitutaceae bacterium]HCR30823.1 hypothetical protein [Opitutae bacterium]|tara:strand:+ start:711 stop:929 length:219 start_codon:yes stop_codon:yes gene_type:complete